MGAHRAPDVHFSCARLCTPQVRFRAHCACLLARNMHGCGLARDWGAGWRACGRTRAARRVARQNQFAFCFRARPRALRALALAAPQKPLAPRGVPSRETVTHVDAPGPPTPLHADQPSQVRVRRFQTVYWLSLCLQCARAPRGARGGAPTQSTLLPVRVCGCLRLTRILNPDPRDPIRSSPSSPGPLLMVFSLSRRRRVAARRTALPTRTSARGRRGE